MFIPILIFIYLFVGMIVSNYVYSESFMEELEDNPGPILLIVFWPIITMNLIAKEISKKIKMIKIEDENEEI